MKKMRMLLMLAALTVSVSVTAAGSIGHARLHPIGQSGIQARIFFVDDGTTLRVLGVAEGLDPTATYISLVYGEGSVPGGPNACEPTPILANALTGPQMVVGLWTVSLDGTGVLTAAKTGAVSYVPVSNTGTISIRQIGVPANLRACGVVAVNPQ